MFKLSRSSTDQEGMISGVSVLVALAVLCIIGFATYMVYRTQHAKPVATDAPQIARTQATTNWRTFSSKEGVSFKYPTTNNCESFVTETDEASQSYALGERINTAGVSCPLEYGAAATPLLFSAAVVGSTEDRGNNYGEKQMADNSLYKLTAKATVTNSGISGTRWVYQSSDKSAATVIYYYFKAKTLSFAIAINGGGSKPDGFDVTALGEQIYATLSLAN